MAHGPMGKALEAQGMGEGMNKPSICQGCFKPFLDDDKGQELPYLGIVCSPCAEGIARVEREFYELRYGESEAGEHEEEP